MCNARWVTQKWWQLRARVEILLKVSVKGGYFLSLSTPPQRDISTPGQSGRIMLAEVRVVPSPEHSTTLYYL